MTEHCEAEGCVGGWIEVDAERYAVARWPHRPGETPEQWEGTEAKRRRYGEAWRPCQACRPGLFDRWVNGCYSPAHVSAECPLCIDVYGPTLAGRRR